VWLPRPISPGHGPENKGLDVKATNAKAKREKWAIDSFILQAGVSSLFTTHLVTA